MAKKTKTKTTRISGASIPSADPDDFTIVEDPGHLLHDDRVHLPLQEALVLSIMTHGVLEAVTVVRDGSDLLVADGRQRVKNAREANRRLKAQGSMPVRVPYVCKRGSDRKILGVMASTFIRTEDSPVSRAHKMQKHVDIGRSHAEIAIDFGCSPKVVKETLLLLDCSESVRKAVSEGLPVRAAGTLAKLPREEQTKALARMREAGAAKGTRAKEAAAEIATGKPKPPRMLSPREITAIRMRLEAQVIVSPLASSSAFAASVLRFVLGEEDTFFERSHPWHARGGDEPAKKEGKKSNGHHHTLPVPSILAGSRP
jgi:ParB family transcriptional regulator, chromosome partitioning protein